MSSPPDPTVPPGSPDVVLPDPLSEQLPPDGQPLPDPQPLLEPQP